ncbi:hypothetical protein CBL_11759 [Carabus blaptoides fortunei]
MLMDGKKHKHIEIFKSLENDMKERGFIKTASQMKIKLKHLKEMYFKCKRNNSRSGSKRETFQYYDLMDELLGSRPSSAVVENSDIGIDSSLVETYMFEEANIIQLSENETSSVINENVVIEDVTACSPLTEESTENSGDTTPVHKKGGRNSYAKSLEVFHVQQMKSLAEILQKQNECQIEAMHTEMEAQRKWEMEALEKEHNFQNRQMSIMMDGFLRGLQSINNSTRKRGRKNTGKKGLSSESESD